MGLLSSNVLRDFPACWDLSPGHASETDKRQPPRGLQLTLARAVGARAEKEASVGTIVMSNLGYFQVGPPRWLLTQEGLTHS